LSGDGGINADIAATSLSRFHDPRIVPALIATLGGGSTPRESVIKALGEVGDPALPYLDDALKSRDWKMRKGASRVLNRYHRDYANSTFREAHDNLDYAIIAGAYSFYFEADIKVPDSIMIDALYKYGDEEMAKYYQACNNQKLSDACGDWMADYGSFCR